MRKLRAFLLSIAGLLALFAGSPSSVQAQACDPISMSDCTVKLRFRALPDGVDRFVVICQHATQSPTGNGINPVTEGVTFELQDQLGGACFSETIASNKFLRTSSGWEYKSDAGNTAGIRRARIKQDKGFALDNKLSVKSKAADLQCLSSAPVIGLTIGDDCGTKTCVLRSGTVYECQ